MLRRSTLIKVGAAVFIVGFWAVMMGRLAYREGYMPWVGGPARATLTRSMEPSDSWMGIYTANHTRVGFINTTTFPDTRAATVGMSIHVNSQFDIALLGAPISVTITGSAFIPQEKGVSELNFHLRSAEHTMRVAGTVEDGLLDATLVTAGERVPLRFNVGDDFLVAAGGIGGATLNVPELQVGEEILVDVFDPMTMSMGKARVRCVGEEELEIIGERVQTKIIETNMQGMRSKAWVTHDEEVVRAETPLGLYLQKIAPEEGLSHRTGLDHYGDAAADLVQAVAVTPTGLRPRRGLTRMTVRLSHPGRQTAVSDDVQTVEDGVYSIVMQDEPGEVAAHPDNMDPYLSGDPFIQAEHPRISAMAQEIVGDENDLWAKALKIYDWVFENIEKTPVFSIPSALETLDTRKGDCNEVAVLYTALARAAGVPARIACGLVWSDDLEGFYYHAWPEVWAGRWLWIDPTLGQRIADATHIKLFSGSLERWPQLAAYLGQLEIEVLSIE